MKKKIFILSLVIVFFVSTTSLPITVHLCRMAQKATTSNCNMMGHCKISCKNQSVKEAHLLQINNNCCSTKTIDTSVKDEYLSQKNGNSDNIQSLVFVLTNNPFESIEQLNSNKKYFQDFSPPLLTNNTLYLSNSVLLI